LPAPTSPWSTELPFPYGTPDAYQFYLDMGPLSNANEKYFKDKPPFWNLNIAHTTYDEVWQSRASRSGTLTVGTGAFAPIKPEVWNFEVSGANRSIVAGLPHEKASR